MVHTPIKENELHGGAHKIYRFQNGLGASVERHDYSYGVERGKWELGVIKFVGDTDEWNRTYVTEVTNDVLGYLEWSEVEEYLDQIAALQAP